MDDNFDWLFEDTTLMTDVSLHSPVRKDIKAERIQLVNGLKQQALSDLIPELPSPDITLFVLSNGAGQDKENDNRAFEFGHFVPVLAKLCGFPSSVHISTWSMNHDHAVNLLAMVDRGEISLSFLIDRSFRGRKSAIAATMIEGLKARGQRIRFILNHAKVLSIKGSNSQVVVFGSANLSSQPRPENFTISTNPELYDWTIKEFFEVFLNAQT